MKNQLLMFITYFVLNPQHIMACTDSFENESDWSVTTPIDDFDDFDHFDEIVEQVKYYEKFSSLTLYKISSNPTISAANKEGLKSLISSFYSIAYAIEKLTSPRFSHHNYLQIRKLFFLLNYHKDNADSRLSSNEFTHVEAISKDELYIQLESVKYFLLDKI